MIDKSIRQYYQDGENVGPFERGRKIISPEKTKLVAEDSQMKKYADIAANSVLNKWGIASQDIKNIKEGKPVSKVAANILKRLFGLGGEETKSKWGPTTGDSVLGYARKGLNISRGTMNVLDAFSGKGLPTMLKQAAFPVAAVAGITYLHKNRERFTGYPTQVAYEQARQKDINIDRIDMRSDPKTLENLKINWERQGFSDDEIRDKTNQYKGETTVMKADVVGADIGNPNEMKNLDKNFEKIKYNIDTSIGEDEPSWTGEDPEGQAEASPTVSETAAMEDININQAPVITPYVPPPAQLSQAPPGSGDRHGGGVGGYRGDPGGGAAGSPFKKGGRIKFIRGGRIDKALGGRSRDI
jgi:hypothetical protein